MSTEEETTATATASAALSVGEEPPLLSGKRARKQTTFFEVQRPSAEKDKEREKGIPEGRGEALGESAHFVAELNRLRSDDDLVKALYALCFDRSGKKTETKKHLRAFKGFPADSKKEEKVSRVLEKKKHWTVSALKQALSLCGQPVSGERERLAQRLVDFLAEPRFDERQREKKESGKKRKAAKKSDKPKKKRAPTAFLLFSNDKREEVKKKSPELTFGEVGKRLGEMWRELGDAQKKKWLDKAAEAKAALAGEDADAEEENEEEEEGEGEGEEHDEAEAEDPFADFDEEEEETKEEEKTDEAEPAKEEEKKEEKTDEKNEEEEAEKEEEKPAAAKEKKKRGKK